jgi:hypothetical protein
MLVLMFLTWFALAVALGYGCNLLFLRTFLEKGTLDAYERLPQQDPTSVEPLDFRQTAARAERRSPGHYG